MIQGFNTDIKINSSVYHIQTELVGNRIVSLIFENGAVVGGRKTEILSGKLSPNGELTDEMKASMKKQHTEIVAEIKAKDRPPIDVDIEKETDDDDLIKKFLDGWVKK
jgi:hypothetical protein